MGSAKFGGMLITACVAGANPADPTIHQNLNKEMITHGT
ncbi:hypothetical protein B4168_3113 [Anoxybacillus flavithermus]|nr:hypothetical protein B4168_3113 [Anoxybacillus flavithermus]OAO86401.1 hypothetical protein GT23_2294 [Parageobacillus thermoglucosidasius]